MTTNRFNPEDVIGLLADRHGDLDRDMDAFVHVSSNGGFTTVSLTDVPSAATSRPTVERFRVTVQRIEAS